MTRPSILSDAGFSRSVSAGVLAACLGCAQAPGIGPVFATAPELPSAPRHPDGVSVDPAAELPASSDAEKTLEPVVVLRPPVPEKAVEAVISDFFRSIAANDMDKLADLLTSDAGATARWKGAAPGLLDFWRTRTRRLSYKKISPDLVYDPAQVEIYRYDDLATAKPGRPLRPHVMIRSDLLARVPIATVRVGHERLFGDEILFVLRRDQGALRIREAAEDFQLP
jgi:hypothetical protein